MAVKPKLGEYTKEKELGTGALQKSFDYLKESDPVGYYYNKLKYEGNKYLRDDMWNEALRRGETATLVNLLSERQKIESGKEYTEQYKGMTVEALDKSGIDALSKWEAYGNTSDYDGYILALSIPTLDDTVKKPRTTADGSYKFGDFTDREWATQILENQFQRYDAIITEEEKNNQNFFQRLGNTINSIFGNIAVGISNFVVDVFNIGEGVLNIMFNWSGDKIEDRFLWAFSNDPTNPLQKAMYEFHRENSILFGEVVDPIKAYEEGYTTDSDMIGAGMTTFGKYWNGISESIGYMLPSILLTQGLGIALKGVTAGSKIAGTVGQTVFYTGIFSGNIKDTVGRAAQNGISYKELNAGEVVMNAGIKAAAQLMVEKILGKIMGASKLDTWIGTGTKATAKGISDVAATGIRAAGQVALRAGKDALKEGLEEALQDLSDGIIDTVFGQGGSELNELYASRGQETISFQNIADAFVMGALTSIVMGTVGSARFVPASQRGVGVDADGKTYTMGFFQTLNFKDALATMNEWNNTINDQNASAEARQNAALRISMSMSTLGSVIRTMGDERAIKANNLLNKVIDAEAKKKVISVMSHKGYAKNLYETFTKHYGEKLKDYIPETLGQKIRNAIDKAKNKLQEHNVTEIKNIVTEEASTDNTNLPQSSLDVLKKVAKGLGAEVIVGTDGSVVTRAEDILFVDNKLLEIGQTDGIIQGETYERIENTVIDTLTDSQKEFLTEQYGKVVNTDVTLENAIRALLFDKEFYTRLLLLSEDTKSNDLAVSFLTDIYTIVKNKALEQNVKGSISKSAGNMLLEKVLNTLRNGLISYATKYVDYDVEQLTNDVFPKELKDAVKNHQNTLRTNFVNDLKQDIETKTFKPDLLEKYDTELDKYSTYAVLTQEQIDKCKTQIRSINKLERFEAQAILVVCYRLARQYDPNIDTTLLVKPTEADKVVFEGYLNDFTTYCGVSFDEFKTGEFDPNKLTDEFKQRVINENYDLGNITDRVILARYILSEVSNKQYTTTANFIPIKVIPKSKTLKHKYLSADGNKKLFEDIKSGKVKTVKDILRAGTNIDTFVKNLTFKIIPFDGSTTAQYSRGDNFIQVTTELTTSTLMEELTHATQYQLAPLSDDELTGTGGSEDAFLLIEQETKDELDTYLQKIFPTLSTIINKVSGRKEKYTTSIYVTLDGEMQANMSFSQLISEIGFTYTNNGKTLVGPDGRKFDISISNVDSVEMTVRLGLKNDFVRYRNVILSLTPKKYLTKVSENIDNIKDIYTKLRTNPTSFSLLSQLTTLAKSIAKTLVDKNTNLDSELDKIRRARAKNIEIDSDQIMQVEQLITPLMVDEDTKLAEANRILNTRLYKGTDTKGITEFDNTKGQKKRTVEKAIWFSDNINVAESYMPKEAGSLYDTNVTFNNPLVIDAKGAVFSNLFKGLDTDSLAKYAKLYDYDALIILNIKDPGPYYSSVTDTKQLREPSTDVVVFNNDNLVDLAEQGIPVSKDILIKGETAEEDTKTNIDTAKAFDKVLGKTRYIPNKRANESNLKYFVKKGVPIQMHPGVADFIESTTTEFDKLPNVLKDKIKAGTLNKYDILDYVATANNIDDFTFKAIAKNVFNNTEAEKITYKDMKKLFNELEELATISYIVEHPDRQLTPTELLNEKKVIWKKLNENNKEFNKQYKTATEQAISFRLDDKRVDEVHADPSQLQIAFFRIYDGSLKSMRDLNNYGKLISVMQDPEALDLARIEGDTDVEGEEVTKDISTARTNWNWTESQKFADMAYKYDEAQDILDDITREDKVAAIKDYLINTTSAKLAAQTFTREQQLQIARGLQERLDKIENASDAEIDKRYLVVMANEGTRVPSASKPVETVSKVPYEQQAPSKKNIKDQLRNLGRTITKRIAGLKSRYNLLSDEVKEYIDSKTYTLNDKYKSLSIEELNAILPKFQEASKSLKSRITKSEIESRIQEEVEKRIAKLTKSMKGPKEEKATKKTIREKIEVKYTTKIVNQEFTVSSPIELTKNDNPDIMTSDKLVHNLLSTNWEKYTEGETQGVETRDVKSVASVKDFITQNTDTLLSADLTATEEAARWFLTTTLNNASDEDFRQFNIIKQYYLEFILIYTKAGSLYENMNANIKQQIDNWVEKNASQGGTALSIHNNMLSIKDPLKLMRSADMILDGVVIEGENKDKLFEAIESGDITNINKVQRELIEYVESKKTAKRSFARKVVTVRSMSMLSGPLTWLRNRVSNIVLKRLNKLSSLLGNKMFKNKAQQGQLKLTAQITPEIQQYIVDNFVNNEFFDTIISNISKYNPSDIQSMKQTDTGLATKDAVMAQLVIKSLYNEYYNKNMFKSKFMNQIHQGLMKVMSDDSYVREAAIRYFGKMLAENNRALDKGVTDEIMNDFAKALGLALNDYMHSENFFNKWENILLERGEAGWFLYKTVLPFASASWNWFKAMIKMSPIGLARSIVNMATLEKRVAKAQQLWQEGKTQISPELTEYIARRDLGQGVIGTVAFILGTALAALGFIQLDDDDYGNPKLTIGNIKVDISSIFGSSSLLAGAALVTGFKDEGSFNVALNRTLDVMLDNFPIMQILELDMYSNGTWDIITSTLESTALSFIPNFLSYLAGATYAGEVKKDKFWKRAVAKIPFLVNILDKKVDPYTGETGSYINALNRMIPYFSLKVASDNEKKTTELGLNKTMLRGQYSINGEDFNVTGKDLDTINKLYGKWNATDLTKFYDNKMKVEVKVGNTYKALSYNQMDNKQRKSAIQTIMSNNAELAKIYAWTIAGNKYYASEIIYAKLKKNGISKNVYRGSQGFVKKK